MIITYKTDLTSGTVTHTYTPPWRSSCTGDSCTHLYSSTQLACEVVKPLPCCNITSNQVVDTGSVPLCLPTSLQLVTYLPTTHAESLTNLTTSNYTTRQWELQMMRDFSCDGGRHFQNKDWSSKSLNMIGRSRVDQPCWGKRSEVVLKGVPPTHVVLPRPPEKVLEKRWAWVSSLRDALEFKQQELGKETKRELCNKDVSSMWSSI